MQMLDVVLLIRLQRQPVSVPLLTCYHNAIVQGKHVSDCIKTWKYFYSFL